MLDFLRQSSRDYLIAAIVFTCVSIGLFLDNDASLLGQYALGACAWFILYMLLRGEDSHVRLQVAIVVATATLCEYIFAPTYHIYIYRFDNVPAYIPPGHGMVYLTAVALARSQLFVQYQRAITVAILAIGAAWALWGVTSWAARADTGGAALFLVFAGFVLLGRAPRVYLAAFLITSYLELVGTHWGAWAWAEFWPSWGNLPQANPPSGIAAGYCLLDAIALIGAPWLAKALISWRRVLPVSQAALRSIESEIEQPMLDDEKLGYEKGR